MCQSGNNKEKAGKQRILRLLLRTLLCIGGQSNAVARSSTALWTAIDQLRCGVNTSKKPKLLLGVSWNEWRQNALHDGKYQVATLYEISVLRCDFLHRLHVLKDSTSFQRKENHLNQSNHYKSTTTNYNSYIRSKTAPSKNCWI